jgi:hypothetical protein
MAHLTADLVYPFTGRTVAIDLEMVPIVSALWRLGIQTHQCCQGYPAGLIPGVPDGVPAVICFDAVGRLGPWGLLRGRYRKGGQYATRLAVALADVAPDQRWRAWDWQVNEWEHGSGLLLPNEDLPWLAAQLERIERAAAGQLTFEEAPAS